MEPFEDTEEDTEEDFLDGDSFDELTLPIEPLLFGLVFTGTGFLRPPGLLLGISVAFLEAFTFALEPLAEFLDGNLFLDGNFLPAVIFADFPVAFLALGLTLVKLLGFAVLSPDDFVAPPLCGATFLGEDFFVTTADLACDLASGDLLAEGLVVLVGRFLGLKGNHPVNLGGS